MSDALGKKTVQNIGYNSIAKIVQLVFSAIASIILTRTLVPSDYGIIGFAGILISFLSQFGDFGLTNAAIQKKDLSQVDLYTALTIKLFLSLIIFVVAFFCAPLMVKFFDNQAIVPVVRVLASIFVLNSIYFLPNLVLTRDLNYRKISYANMISAFVNSAVAVALALLGFKYWSLVIASISMTASLCLMINIYHPLRFRLAYDHGVAKKLMNFGGNLFLSGFTVFVTFNADNFLIGAVSGATELGYYSVAFTWGTMACTIISLMVVNVLFPTFSKIQEDRERLKSYYLKVLQYVSFGGVLINMTLLVVSRDWLVLVLGSNTEKWLPALYALRIICIYGVFRLLLEPVGPVMMAIGRTNVLRKATLLVAVIELGGLYPVLNNFGIVGVALLVTIAYVSQYALYIRSLRKELQIGFRELARCVAPAVLAAIPFAGIFLAGETIFDISIVVFIGKLIACTGLYLIFYGLVNRWTLYRDIRSLAKSYA